MQSSSISRFGLGFISASPDVCHAPTAQKVLCCTSVRWYFQSGHGNRDYDLEQQSLSRLKELSFQVLGATSVDQSRSADEERNRPVNGPTRLRKLDGSS